MQADANRTPDRIDALPGLGPKSRDMLAAAGITTASPRLRKCRHWKRTTTLQHRRGRHAVFAATLETPRTIASNDPFTLGYGTSD
jgi:hypothetical protein